MSTTSTQGMMQDLRSRLLNFEPRSGDTLNTSLGGRLYTTQAPDKLPDQPYPYAVVRLMDRQQTVGDQGFRTRGEIEVQIFDRPRSQQWRAEAIADVVQQAFLHWDLKTSGLMFAQHSRRVGPLPPAPAPMDRELVHIAVYVPIVAWPVMFTQYFTSSPE
jgi:hypothetical protein